MKYDFIIIGSGLGGLNTAYILSKEGFNVCVLEQGSQFGGSIQNFGREGVIFDTGAHYVGSLDQGQTLHRYFDYFDLNTKLKLKRMDDDCFDEISFGSDGKTYAHAMGFDRFADKLVEHFPNDKSGIQSYAKSLKNIGESFPMFSLTDDSHYSDAINYMRMGVGDFVKSISQNKRLQDVLFGSNLLYSGEEYKSPLHIHGLIANSYIQSSYRFIGGSGQIARHLIASIRSFGGQVIKNKKVIRLQMNGRKISSVLTSDGEVFEAETIISNVHPKPTFDMLPKEITKKVYFKRVSGLENTLSVFSLYIVFKKDCFKYINHNVYHQRQDDVWVEKDYDANQWPKNFLFLTQVPKDESTFAEGATVMTSMRYEEYAKWVGTEIENRPADYDALKKQHEEILLDAVAERFPGIKSCIKSVYSSTPLTYKDYTATCEGSIYGVARDYNEQTRSMIMPNTKIPNLFLTGQNVNLHGVLGVTVGSILTASKFIGAEYLLNKIR